MPLQLDAVASVMEMASCAEGSLRSIAAGLATAPATAANDPTDCRAPASPGAAANDGGSSWWWGAMLLGATVGAVSDCVVPVALSVSAEDESSSK